MITKDDDQKADLRWGRFALRVALGVAWMVLAGAAALLLRHDGLGVRIAAALAIALPAFVWMAALSRQAQIDELEARIALTAQAQGCWWAVSFGASFYALMTAMEAPPDAVLLAVLPAGAFFFGEVMAQVARWALSRPRLAHRL